MDYGYVKEIKEIKDKNMEEKKIELQTSIVETTKALENANKNYEYAEGNLIDYYLYEIKANQSKLDYLIKVAKQNGIQGENKIKTLILKGKKVI